MIDYGKQNGKPRTAAQWAAGLLPEERVELYQTLAPFMGEASTPSQGPVSLEKISADFGRLSKEDCMAFIKSIQAGVDIAEDALFESGFDRALSDELAKRKGQKAVDDAWARSVAGAKARAEQAAKEVL